MYTQCSIKYFLSGPMIIIQGYCLEVLFISLSSRYSRVLAGVALGVGRVSPGVLSSSVKLNDSHLHTGLGRVCNMFHGVVGSGSNEACLMLETWWILGIFLSGVGKLIESELLS